MSRAVMQQALEALTYFGVDEKTIAALKAELAQPEQPAETQHGIAHSLAGFRGGFQAEHGRKPTEQEIWNHAIRSWRDLNPEAQPVQPEQEPVAWMYAVNHAHTCLNLFEPPDDAYDEGTLYPLYTAPPQRQPDQEPFGYFKPEPFGWIDCEETDEGAKPLYENPFGIKAAS